MRRAGPLAVQGLLVARAPPETADGARQLAGSVAALRLMMAVAPGAPDLAGGVPSIEIFAAEWAVADNHRPPPVQCAYRHAPPPSCRGT